MVRATIESVKQARFPNFLILGAAKSGTTSLHGYISQHPEIFMSPVKEPDFFVWMGQDVDIRGPRASQVHKRIVADEDRYKALFDEATNESALGEASTAYLYTEEVPARIREHIPDAKLIAILRNPIDRAYSAFLHARRAGFEPIADFGAALKAEPDRIRDRWGGLTHYTTVSRYVEQLERYSARFPAQQMRVYLYEDMVRDPSGVAKDVFRFLGVDPTFEPDVASKRNQRALVRSPRLHALMSSRKARSVVRRFLPDRLRPRLYSSLRDRNQLEIDPISPDARASLVQLFETDIHMLSKKLGRDLSAWLDDEEVRPPDRGQALGMQPVDDS